MVMAKELRCGLMREWVRDAEWKRLFSEEDRVMGVEEEGQEGTCGGGEVVSKDVWCLR